MCGISGIAGGDPDELRPVVEAQLALLEHRGPDAAGSFAGGAAVIAQNRLAIIDLVTGDPPITNEDGSVAVVQNGEIYNFAQLRSELEAAGHAFRSHGDTETIAHLAEDHAPVELARKLDGMFAFAVWDERRGRLVIGRDRVGKKPLYYWSAGGKLVFGSELKAVFADTNVPRRLDPQAIPAYLTFGYVPTPRTFFEGVKSLPPGHVLTFEPGGEPVIERYWEPPVAGVNGTPTLDLSLDEAAREVRRRLEDAVRRRLIADVPLGAFLSGGIDSSAIVAIMAGQIDRPVQTFTIGFEDQEGFDERPYGRMVAERHGAEHHEFVVHPDAVDLVERLVWHHDQPFGDSSAIPTFLLSEVTRRHVTVALSGDGGDELFAGYERFAAGLAARRYASLPGVVQHGIRGVLDLLPAESLRGRAGSLQRFARVAELGLPDAYRAWISYVPDDERAALLNGSGDDWGLEDYRSTWRGSDGARTLDRLLDLNLRTYLLDDLLVKADRMSMAHGLEVRCPLLDRRVVELAFRIPASRKQQGTQGKALLRALARRRLPGALWQLPKRGFTVPIGGWLAGRYASPFRDEVLRRDAAVSRHIDVKELERRFAEHRTGHGNHAFTLWSTWVLQRWLGRIAAPTAGPAAEALSNTVSMR
jgi:asparagine synthase (glutamine-hydrolysing)